MSNWDFACMGIGTLGLGVFFQVGLENFWHKK